VRARKAFAPCMQERHGDGGGGSGVLEGCHKAMGTHKDSGGGGTGLV